LSKPLHLNVSRLILSVFHFHRQSVIAKPRNWQYDIRHSWFDSFALQNPGSLNIPFPTIRNSKEPAQFRKSPPVIFCPLEQSLLMVMLAHISTIHSLICAWYTKVGFGFLLGQERLSPLQGLPFCAPAHFLEARK